jgi:hypothetical protein
VSTISIFIFLLLFQFVGIPIEFGWHGHQTSNMGVVQLDDGIVDTLVSALRHASVPQR